MNKTTKISIGILAIGIVLIGEWWALSNLLREERPFQLTDCSFLEQEIKQEIEKANYCEKDEDCVVVGITSNCKFGCHLIVNREVAFSKINKDLERYRDECNPCILECPSQPKELGCVDNKCVGKPIDETQKILEVSIFELIENPEKYLNRTIKVIGVLKNIGKSYFVNPKFVLQGESGDYIEVNAWLPLEFPPLPPGVELPGEKTIGDYLEKKLRLEGTLKRAPDGDYFIEVDRTSVEVISEEVTITTDKREYEQGEKVKITIENNIDTRISTIPNLGTPSIHLTFSNWTLF
jgi:hypothetical protein